MGILGDYEPMNWSKTLTKTLKSAFENISKPECPLTIEAFVRGLKDRPESTKNRVVTLIATKGPGAYSLQLYTARSRLVTQTANLTTEEENIVALYGTVEATRAALHSANTARKEDEKKRDRKRATMKAMENLIASHGNDIPKGMGFVLQTLNNNCNLAGMEVDDVKASITQCNNAFCRATWEKEKEKAIVAELKKAIETNEKLIIEGESNQNAAVLL
ncbi:uncharacterized protein FTOL_00079 [Fusarium torulosum]|uniref:Uncharacterized protein n=1 Tax=Fusarium torulosum TaxID=33205 RepID=A0AAE8SC69_9HYPO|nr:uncharacterized protein FTOL_00079 [Fusarium torulosum]